MTENPAARFAEIRALLAALPGADADADADAVHAKPPRSWPGGDPLVRWLAAWQGRARPRLDRPRLLLFAARHGIGAEPADAIAARLAALVDGAAPAHTRAAALDVDMRAFDMAIAIPTRDARAGPATTEAECVRDVAYGMMAVEPGLDLLVLATFAAGEAHVVPALAAALGHPPAPRSDTPAAAALARQAGTTDPLALLAALAGREIAAVAGAILAARLARVPVVLDGAGAVVAAAVVHALAPGATLHCALAAPDPLGLRLRLAAIAEGAEAGDGIAGLAALAQLRFRLLADLEE